jgi:RHS repeat-associated protein
MRVTVTVFCLSAAISCSLSAQQAGQAAPSFRAENLYSFGSLDSVAVMQGGLSIQLPITTFGSEIQTALQLVYQSAAWEALPQSCPPQNNCALLYPKKQSRAGLGWRVSLGDLYQPSPGGAHTPQRFVWASSDGGEHALYPTLHPDDPQDSGDPVPSTAPFEKVMYTRDGSYARLKCDSAPPEPAGFGDCALETASGEKHFFNNTSGGSNASYRLESITDRFGNQISIQYLSNPTRWRIFDAHTTPNSGRDIILTFSPPVSNAGDQPLLLRSIDLPCYVANGESSCRGESGARTTWEFDYALKTTFPPAVYGQSPVARPVWFLDQVDLPDGSSFTFPDYSTTTGGGLMTMELPTVGSVEWTWADSVFPAVRDVFPCPSELPPYAEYWTNVFGVSERREYGLDHTLRGVTTYRRFPDVEEPGVAEIWTVLVESPLGDLSEYFFSVWNSNVCNIPQHDSEVWEYGLPYSKAEPDPISSSPQRFLSSNHYDCAESIDDPEPDDCTLLRATYQAWEIDDGDLPGGWRNGEVNDRNRRVRSERTLFLDDSTYKIRSMTDFDGLGSYRTTEVDGTLESSQKRTTFVDTNFLRGTYTGLPGQSYDPIDRLEPWILGNFRLRSTEEGGVQTDTELGTVTQRAVEEFCFEDTGFLLRRRTLSSDVGDRGERDVVTVFTRDAAGRLTREQWFGGDKQPEIDIEADLCDLVLPEPDQYRVQHEYDTDTGLKSRSQWRDSSGGTTGGLNFYTLDRTLDFTTNLVRSTRDIAGVQTQYAYDSSSRLLEVRPSATCGANCGSAWEEFDYVNAVENPGANDDEGARVEHRAFGNGGFGGEVLREEHWVYEGLGRLTRERRRAKDNQFDDRFRYYDVAGHQDYLSEWGRGATTSHFGLEWSDFDPFDRPKTVKRFSNNTELRTEATIGYQGERQVTRRQWIATSAPGGVPTEEAVDRVETFDDHSRLVRVSEFSDGGSAIDTSYAYDVSNRLRRVQTPRTGGGNQVRWFLYDQRGFLSSERVPEKGASGDGTVFYGEYDALGNSWNRFDGIELDYTFDRAGRMTKIEETLPRAGLSPIVRPLKEFTYGSANLGGSLELGKLLTARSYNWVTIGASAHYDARFVEAFQYQGVAGARSHRAVTFRLGLQPPPAAEPWVVPPEPPSREAFSHSESFDALGQRTAVTYPVCLTGLPDSHCSASQPVRTVNSTYVRGYLNTVADAGFDWVSGATYHRSGLWNTMSRGNGVVETQAHEDLQIPRPKSIEAKVGVAPALWKSGTMAYDRSGNLTRMQGNEEGGSDLYLYDKVSRLKQAQVHVPAALGDLIFSDGFESGASERWLDIFPPAGWAAGMKTQNFTFDRFGNLTRVATTGEPTEEFPTSQTSNRMLNSGTQTYHSTYDDRGNLVEFDGTLNSFDSLNRQWRRQSPDGSAQHYLYTADDERLMTTFSSGGVSFRWTLRDFGGKVLRVYENAGTGEFATAVRDYIHAGERILGSEDPRNPASTRMLATVDHLGTPRLWTDSSGNPLRKHKYFPFGKEATPSDQWPIALQFTGHERDPNDLSLTDEDSDYMHARFGGSAVGRLMSLDPILQTGRAMSRPQLWNRFTYALDNPLSFTDPTGKDVSIGVTFTGGESEYTGQQKRLILDAMRAFWGGLGAGTAYVFDTATEHEANTGEGVAAISISSDSGTSYPSMVKGGGFLGDDQLSTEQQAKGIANVANHELFSHTLGLSATDWMDIYLYSRDPRIGSVNDPLVVERYGTVADSNAPFHPDTRALMTTGPMPVHSSDLAQARAALSNVALQRPLPGPRPWWKIW